MLQIDDAVAYWAGQAEYERIQQLHDEGWNEPGGEEGPYDMEDPYDEGEEEWDE